MYFEPVDYEDSAVSNTFAPVLSLLLLLGGDIGPMY